MSGDILKGIKQIAEYIGESERTTRRWCESGRIPAFRNETGRWRMRKSDYRAGPKKAA